MTMINVLVVVAKIELDLLCLGDNGLEHDGQASNNAMVDATIRKRSYIHRLRVQKETNKNHMFNKKCDVAEVQKVVTVDCCKLRCCQVGDILKIMHARTNLWGQSYSNRCTFV